MATIATLLSNNATNITSQTTAGSITPTIDGGERAALINELLARGVKSVADTTALSAVSGADFRNVAVTATGMFEWLTSGTPNGTTIFAASGGGVWNLVFNAGVATPQLATPELTLTVISDTQINATWLAVTDAANYQLYRATASDFTGETLVYDGALLLFNSTGLSAATPYYFRLKARGYERMNSAYATDSATTDAAAATPLTAGSIAQFLFDEGSGQKIFNKRGATTENHNLIHPSEQQWTGESNLLPSSIYNRVVTTGTNNYRANAAGVVQMRRIVTVAGTGDVPGFGALAGERIQGQTFPAGTYKLSLEVISNTGSAQAMRMQIAGGAYSSDLTVGTTHSRVSATLTHPGGSPLIYFAVNDSAGNALDISFDKIYFGDPAFDYVEPDFDLQMGLLGTSAADDFSWVAGKGVSAATDAQWAYAMRAVPETFTNISVHTVQKATAHTTRQNISFSSKYGDGGFEIGSGVGGSVDSGILPHFKFRNQQAAVKVSKFADGLYHHYCGTYDGTNLKYYVDGILLATFPATLTSVAINRMLANGSFTVGGLGGTQEINYAEVFNVAHTQAEVLQQKAWLDEQMALRGITIADLPNVLAVEGDSISVDVNNYARKGLVSMTTSLYGEMFAAVGSQITTLNSRKATVKAWLNQFPTKNRIMSLLIGANDLTNPGMDVPAWIASVKAYCLEMKTDVPGLKIVLMTPLPNTTGSELTNRAIAIPLITADTSYYDELVRFDLVSGMGADADASNTTNYPDGVHPSNTGHNLLYPSFVTGLTNQMV